MTINLDRHDLPNAPDLASAITPVTSGGESRLRRLHSSETIAGRVTGIYELAELGKWRIGRWVVTEQNERTEQLRSRLSSSSRGRMCPCGVYTALERRAGDAWVTVMSDTPDELLDLAPLAREAKRSEARRVIVNGLGLGCALRVLLQYPHVEHLDVVELDPEVIGLVGSYFVGAFFRCNAIKPCGRVEHVPGATGDEFFCCRSKMRRAHVEIHEGDAYTYKWPVGTRWDLAWHDVWDDISADNDFAGLHRRYGRRVSWQASWCREHAEESARRWNRENAWWLNR